MQHRFSCKSRLFLRKLSLTILSIARVTGVTDVRQREFLPPP